jgi:hypothetical protein
MISSEAKSVSLLGNAEIAGRRSRSGLKYLRRLNPMRHLGPQARTDSGIRRRADDRKRHERRSLQLVRHCALLRRGEKLASMLVCLSP